MSTRRKVLGRFIATIGAAVVVVYGARAADPPLFLVNTPFDPLPTGIYVVDPSTGLMTLRASIDVSYGAMLGLAAANDQVLYATGSDASGCFSCFLFRITLDPASTTPLEILPIGPVLDGTTLVDEITGLTFRDDGTLWMIDEHTEGLYTIDPATAAATRIGTVSTDILGGDLTTDEDGTFWMWSNAPSDHGLYELDPVTAIATLDFLRPDLRMAGLAALGHSNVLYGTNPGTDRLYEIFIPSGFTGFQPQLILDGTAFDHKRGDLDSPHCSNDAWCDDANACTTDTCTPGGCVYVVQEGCCTSDPNCDDGNACNGAETCDGTGACQPGTPPDCSDGNVCTDDACDPQAGCLYTDNTAACDDGNACTSGDVCAAGACQAGTPSDCSDGNACTDDACDPQAGCLHTDNGAPCDDGDACTSGDVCGSGACQPGTTTVLNQATGLTAAADKTTYAWSAVPGATTYDAVRGLTSAMPVGPGGGDELCFPGLDGPVLVDATVPASGTGFWYLVRAANSCGIGTFGTQSNGTQRVTTTCP